MSQHNRLYACSKHLGKSLTGSHTNQSEISVSAIRKVKHTFFSKSARARSKNILEAHKAGLGKLRSTATLLPHCNSMISTQSANAINSHFVTLV